MPFKSRKWLLIAVAACVLGYLLYRSRTALHLAESWQAVKAADLLYLLGAVLVIYTCYFLRALRWRSFQKHLGEARFLPILAMTLAGFASIYLFGRLGEPVRPVLIARKSRVPLADIFGIYALERVIDMLFAGAMLAAWFLSITVEGTANPALEGVRKTAGTVLTLGVIGVATVVIYVWIHGAGMLEGRMGAWLAAGGWRAAVARAVLGVVRGFKTIQSWRDFSVVLSISVVHWFLIILIYQLIELGFGGKLATLRFQDSMLIVALTMVGSLLQLPGIGGGPQVVMTGAFTQLYGVPYEAAFAASMVIFLVTFAVCSFVGVPILFREGFSLAELKHMREERSEVNAEMLENPASEEGL
jgi:glycosyltransferase 2 family protein